MALLCFALIPIGEKSAKANPPAAAYAIFDEYLAHYSARGQRLPLYSRDLWLPLGRRVMDPLAAHLVRAYVQARGPVPGLFFAGSDIFPFAAPIAKNITGESNIVPRLAEHQCQWSFIESLTTPHSIDVPEFAGRPALRRNWYINSEGGFDLEHILVNAREGRFVTEGVPMLNVPFKTSFFAFHGADGEAALLFRTESDLLNFERKLITLPDEMRFPSDYLAAHRGWTKANLEYTGVVASRLDPHGFRISPVTVEILRGWIRENPELYAGLGRFLMAERVPQRIPLASIRRFLRVVAPH